MNDLEAFLENLLPEGVVGLVSENRMVVTILSGIVGKAFIDWYYEENQKLHFIYFIFKNRLVPLPEHL